MPVERIYAHPDVQADQGRVALKRGPIVYCVEAVDTPAPPHLLRLPRADLRAARGARVAYVPQDPSAALNPTLQCRH